MLEVQAYLRSGKTPEDLENEFHIHSKPHADYPNLIGFKYDMLDSPMGEQIVQECRGLILDSDNNWDVICHPFNKFFNSAEGHAAEIDWDSAVVQEKVDGSLIMLYFYNNNWHVGTSGSPGASGPVCDLDSDLTWDCDGTQLKLPQTFAEYFWQVVDNVYSDCDAFVPMAKRICFMFELMGPLNRIVVPHRQPKLAILGARELISGEEIPAKEVEQMFHCGIPAVKEFSFDNLDDLLYTLNDMPPLEQEGYVVVDKYFNRIKVKNPGYVALHHAKDGLTQRAFVEIARRGETSEVLTAFPEFEPFVNDAKERFDLLLSELRKDYDRLKNISEQKEFALQAVQTKCSGALFSVRAGKARDIREYLIKMHVDKLMRLLGYKKQKIEKPD